jgi:NTE family protein
MGKHVKVGLALGAGGARGLAHIGVLEVLEENAIPIDLIAGCSMGAVVGSIIAGGTTPRKLHQLAAQICALDYRKLFDITLPRMGLIRGQRVDMIVRTLAGDRTIEQMKIPFASVAACLEDGKIRVFKTGKIADAVRASLSVPGVFEPVKIDGKTYVDGGVLNRVPADVAREMGADFVIAVDVGYRGGPRPAPKNIIDVLLSSFELQEWEALKNRKLDADIVIDTNTADINPGVFNQVEECVKRGRAAALNVIGELKDALDKAGVELAS